MKSKGYVNQLRLVITGGNLLTFSLVLKLIMTYWDEKEANLFANINIHLLPSPEGCKGYCTVNLIDNQCAILVGAELNKDDMSLCKERGLIFTYDDSDDECSRGEEGSSQFSDNSEFSVEEKCTPGKKRDRFFYHPDKNHSLNDEDEPEFKKNRVDI
ncbi:MAG: hypothetical protein H0T84_06645 [Tatlockia sp.]|nr:hypothetical protein [Tatlockia sp.]